MAKTTTPQKKTGEKKEPQQDKEITTVQMGVGLKKALDELKKGNDSYADVIQRLMTAKAVRDAPEDGMVTLRMPKLAYDRLLVMQPSSWMSEALQNARVV